MHTITNTQRWTGRILGGLCAAFLLMDGVMKLVKPAPVLAWAEEFHFPLTALTLVGVWMVLGVVLYAIPRTAALGALFLTAFLGGAVSIHVHAGHPLWTHTLFPTYFAIGLWVGLVLRDARVRAVFFPPAARPGSSLSAE